MWWLHYSNRQIFRSELKLRSQPEPQYFGKPEGLWVTDESEDNWKAWCEKENFMLANLTHVNRLTLDESKMLVLRSTLDVLRFTDEFNVDGFLGRIKIQKIDWRAVAQKFGGIAITPYQWSLRFERKTSWYYGWDCASGCIWDPGVVRSIDLVRIEGAGKKENNDVGISE